MQGSPLLVAAAAMSALIAAPVQAQDIASGPPPATAVASPVAPVSPDAQEIESFYYYRQNAPLWFANGSVLPAAMDLIAMLKRAPLDGLGEGPQLAARIEAALQMQHISGSTGEAEGLLTAAWIAYVRALKAPVRGVIYGDALQRPKPLSAASILRNAAAAATLGDHVTSISQVNPLYASLREAVWAQVQAGIAPDPRASATLERLRMLPAKGRLVMVDIASAHLFMIEDGQIRDSMKVIVGKPEHFTPQIASTIHFVTFNPYWHVPPDMVRRTITQGVKRQGAAYLKRQGYELFDNSAAEPKPLVVTDVDWKAVAADGPKGLLVRQLPGPSNAMGKMKIYFDNDEGIYLHDTPQKDLFENARRTLSGGCIRLEDAPRLVRWLLGSEPIAPSAEPELHVRIPKPVPVFVTYLTAQAVGQQMLYTEDVYRLDAPAPLPQAAAASASLPPAAIEASAPLPH